MGSSAWTQTQALQHRMQLSPSGVFNGYTKHLPLSHFLYRSCLLTLKPTKWNQKRTWGPSNAAEAVKGRARTRTLGPNSVSATYSVPLIGCLTFE